jgi:Flp pilus assembly pilin Flp
MRRLLTRLWDDESGMIVSSEVVLVGTILVIGSLVGLSALSYAINHELNDVANAVSARPDFGSHYDDDSQHYYSITSSDGVTEVVGY